MTPEFSNYLDADEALRLAVMTKSPREVAAGFRAYRSSEYDEAKSAALLKKLFLLLFDHRGAEAAAEFMQEVMR